MMDGEEVYRARLEACLAAAAAAALPQVRNRHLAAAQSWLVLLNDVLERKGGTADFRQEAGSEEAEVDVPAEPIVDR